MCAQGCCHRPLEGHKYLFVVVENQHSRCRLPTFITDHHHWHTLDHSRSYVILHKNTTLRITREEGGQEMRVVCHTEHHTSHHQVTVVAHATSGWLVRCFHLLCVVQIVAAAAAWFIAG